MIKICLTLLILQVALGAHNIFDYGAVNDDIKSDFVNADALR